MSTHRPLTWPLREASIAFALTGIVFTIAFFVALDELGPVGPGVGVPFWLQIAGLLAFLLHFSYVARLWRLARRCNGVPGRDDRAVS